MTRIILDSGPIISLALNNLLWLFRKVKKEFGIEFCITEAVKKEVVDNPLKTKRFKLEALQVLQVIDEGTITLMDESEELSVLTRELLELSNRTYTSKGRNLTLVQYAEVSAIAASLIYGADAIAIDERTTRYMIEKPKKLQNTLRHRMHASITMDKAAIDVLRRKTKGVKFIRSAEFVTIAFEKGLLNGFLPEIPKSHANLLDALLWGLKLNGCAISNKDIETIMRVEDKRK